MTGKIKVLLPLLLIFLLAGCGKTNDGLTIEGHDWTYANAIDSAGQPLDLPALTCSALDGTLTVKEIRFDAPISIEAVAIICLKQANVSYSYFFTLTDPIT